MTPAVFLFGILCILIQNAECEQIVAPRHVTGQLGGSVSIGCRYSTVTKANRFDRKFFCQEGRLPRRCKFTIVSTNSYVHDSYIDRATIDDNIEEGLIVITLSDLKKSDEGTYMCGINTDKDGITAVFKVVVIEDSVIPNEETLLYGHLKGSIQFYCEFEDKYAEERKYLCKLELNRCQNIIDSTGKIDLKYAGRIVLQVNEKKPASFTIQMIKLSHEDIGIYSCGVGNYGVETDTQEFDLRIGIANTMPQGTRSLSSRLGGSVSAQCNYDPKVNYTLKFWCKWSNSACTPLIKSDGFVAEGYEGKLVIYDDPTNGLVQVLMSLMSKEDEGWYWVVLTDGKRDETLSMQVKISEGTSGGLTGGETIEVKKGETAKLSCSISCKFKEYEKYWCIWHNEGCKNVTSNVHLDGNDLSVSCEPRNLVLTIESASQKDNGWYWCGVKKSGIYRDAIAVRLIVKEATSEDRNSNPGSVGENRKVVDNEIITPTSSSGHNPNSLVPAILSVCAAVLVAAAVFFVIRMKRKQKSDLVSVGSYRTNISMTDLDNDIGKENPAVIDTQETDISQSNDGAKIKKKGSREDLDYSSFLIHHNGSPNEKNAP